MNEQFDTNNQMEFERPKRRVDYEQIVDNEDYRFFALTITDENDKKVSFVPLGNDRDDEKARIAREGGYDIEMLPSQGEKFTDTEVDFAQNKLGLSKAKINFPHRNHELPDSANQDHKVVFFEPTAQSLIDIMRMAGHDSSELRDARLAAKHGEPNRIAESVNILLSASKAHQDGASPEDRLRAQALQDGFRTFDVGGISGELERMTERGVDALQGVMYKLERGVDARAIQEVVSGDNDVQKMVQKLWENSVEHARSRNKDPSGVYVEVHKIGNQYIPVPALSSTAWGGPGDEGLGYVAESSSHTLTEIYCDVVNWPEETADQVVRDIRDEPIVELSARLGLNAKTLVSRGRLTEEGYSARVLNGKELYDSQTDSSNFPKKSLAELSAQLHALGIKTQLNGKEGIKYIDYMYSGKIKDVVVDYDQIDMPVGKRQLNSRLMVLTGVSLDSLATLEDDVQGTYVDEGTRVGVHMVEACARRHADIYEELGLPEDSMSYVQIGDAKIGFAGRFTNDEGADNPPEFRLMLHVSEDDLELHKHELMTIAETMRAKLNANNYSGENVELRINYSSNPAEAGWKTLQVQ